MKPFQPDSNAETAPRSALPPASTASIAIAVKPKKASDMLDCGITRLYELIAQGELETYKDGRNRKITVESIRAYIARQIENSKAA